MCSTLLFFMPAAGSSHAQNTSIALMPVPSSIHLGDGAFLLKSDITVGVGTVHSPRLQQAVLRTMHRLADKTGLPQSTMIPFGTSGAFTVNVKSDGPAVQTIDEDESYDLTVTSDSVRIEAPTTLGALHAFETLVQLITPSGPGYRLPAVTIHDEPRFPWRGLMIDCSRHFEPLDVLKRNIDAMAAVKLNVFHWHLADDQGFRIESKRFPKLTSLGSDGLFYTQEQARELVQYASDRGIRVVPEFEMPGHSTAWLMAYPELNSGTKPTGIRREFGISDVALDPTREETYRFIESFLSEMTELFPDQYVHIGGDEAKAVDWKSNPRILAFMKTKGLRDKEELQAYFNRRVLVILTRLHRRMDGWDEILNPALPKDVVIQSWRGEKSLVSAAQQGYTGILSAPYYLDHMQPADVMYLADPIPANTSLTADQQKLVLGGEVCMWAEHIDQDTIDSRIWPRAAAIAERFWSPQHVTDVDDMYRRLQYVSLEIEGFGLEHLKYQEAALRSLLGSEHIDALRSFSEAFEPVSFGVRSQTQHTSQLTPLTEFVDAVRPDPSARHRLTQATRTFLTAPAGNLATVIESRRDLHDFFQATNAAATEVLRELPEAPRLQSVESRAQQLATLSQIGSDAIRFLSEAKTPPSGWKAKSLSQIDAAKAPSALVQFNFLGPLKDLVSATQ